MCIIGIYGDVYWLLCVFVCVCVCVCVGGGGWGGLVVCVQSREPGACALPSDVYPAGKLQWHFTCGFDFRHIIL